MDRCSSDADWTHRIVELRAIRPYVQYSCSAVRLRDVVQWSTQFGIELVCNVLQHFNTITGFSATPVVLTVQLCLCTCCGRWLPEWIGTKFNSSVSAVMLSASFYNDICPWYLLDLMLWGKCRKNVWSTPSPSRSSHVTLGQIFVVHLSFNPRVRGGATSPDSSSEGVQLLPNPIEHFVHLKYYGSAAISYYAHYRQWFLEEHLNTNWLFFTNTVATASLCSVRNHIHNVLVLLRSKPYICN